MIEAALPAKVLRDDAVATWVREHGAAVDVHTSEELAIAIANGVKPSRIVVHGDELGDTELRAVATLGVGPVIIGSIAQADLLAARTAQVQGVLLRMTNANGRGGSDGFGFPFGSDTADITIAAVVADHRLTLTGLQVSVGGNEQACVSFPAAIGEMVASMDQIHRRYGTVLTRLGLDCDLWPGDWGNEVKDVAAVIDEAVDDACEAMRFPRPRVLLSTGD